MAQKIRVGVVDQHPLFREGVVFSLQAQPDLEVSGQGASMRDALLIARESDYFASGLTSSLGFCRT